LNNSPAISANIFFPIANTMITRRFVSLKKHQGEFWLAVFVSQSMAADSYHTLHMRYHRFADRIAVNSSAAGNLY
jgi:hypothetical protein